MNRLSKIAALLIVCAGASSAQTACTPASPCPVVLSETGHRHTTGMGVGFYTANYFNALYCNNVICMENNSFGPTQYGLVETASGGSTTTFQSINIYDPWPANFTTGWNYFIRCHGSGTACSGGATGSTGTLSGNTTGALGGPGVTFNLANSAAAAVVANDEMDIRSPASATTSDYRTLGWNFSGNATCSIDTTTANMPASIYGLPQPLQALKCSGTTGQSETFQVYIDTVGGDLNYEFVGAYCQKIRALVLSGGATIQMFTTRAISGGGYINATQTLSGSGWQNYQSCSASLAETDSTPSGAVAVGYTVTFTSAGAVDFIGTSLDRQTHVYPGPWDDRVIDKIKAMGATGVRFNILGSGGANSFIQSLQPQAYRQPSLASAVNSLYGSTQNPGVGMNLFEVLMVGEAAGATQAEYQMPPTWTSADWAAVPEFLNGSCSTTYGAYRCAMGHTASFSTTFPDGIQIVPDNESWNLTQPGYVYYPGQNGINYLPLAVQACQVMKASASWDSAHMLFAANMQQAIGAGNATQISAADPTHCLDAQDTSVYHQVTAVNCAQPALDYDSWVETYSNTVSTGVTQYQIGASSVPVVAYETGRGTTTGSCTQAQIAGFPEGEGYGLTDVLTHAYLQKRFPGHYLHYYYWELQGLNSSFSSTAGSSPATTIAGWGAYPQAGGDLSVPRPTVFQQASYNGAAGLGDGYTASVTGGPTANFAGENNIPAVSSVPLLPVFAFCPGSGSGCTGGTRKLFIANIDPTNDHAVTFSGDNTPSGTVTKSLYWSANVTDSNETGTINVQNAVTTLTNPTSVTIPAHGSVLLTWTAGATGTLPSGKQSTGAVIESGAVSELRGDSVTLGGNSQAMTEHVGRR